MRAEVEGANNLVEVYDTESVNLCKCASTTITELSYRVLAKEGKQSKVRLVGFPIQALFNMN